MRGEFFVTETAETLEREKSPLRTLRAAVAIAEFLQQLRAEHSLDNDDVAEVLHRVSGLGPRGPPVLSAWIDEAELAARLKVTAVTLRRWRQRKYGPAFRKRGRQVRYHVDAVEAWMKNEQRADRVKDR
jgi:hypothetical protein